MRALVPLGLLLLGTAAAMSPAPASTAGIVSFHTPSRNIYCAYASAFEGQAPSIRCDIERKRWHAPKPHGCPVDWGQGLILGAAPKHGQKGTGRGSVVCAGDTVLRLPGPTLAYGHRFSRGGIACASARRGLTCRNAAGHGFFLSRERYRIF